MILLPVIRWGICALLLLLVPVLALSAYSVFLEIKEAVIKTRGEREDDHNRWSGAFIQEYKQLFPNEKQLIRLYIFQTLMFADLVIIAVLAIFR